MTETSVRQAGTVDVAEGVAAAASAPADRPGRARVASGKAANDRAWRGRSAGALQRANAAGAIRRGLMRWGERVSNGRVMGLR